jgi:hypothetical protein
MPVSLNLSSKIFIAFAWGFVRGLTYSLSRIEMEHAYRRRSQQVSPPGV